MTTVRRSVRRSARGASAASLAVLLAACGTTVPTPSPAGPDAAAAGEELSAPTAPGSIAEPGLSGPVVGPDAGTGPATGTGPSTAGGSSGFGPARSSGSGSSSTATSPSSPARSTSTAPAPGITATHVYVGAPYFPDVGSTNQALGGGEAADQRAMYRAVAEDLNSRGGIRGRKLEPVFFAYSATSNEPIESQSQAACEHWTQDNRVFAIFMRGPTILECAKKAGALVTSASGATGPVYRSNPHLVDPSGIRPERLGAATVRGLYDIGWGKPNAEWPTGKVGIISWDEPNYRYGVEHGHVPALSSVGVKPTDIRYITVPQTAGAIADSSAAVSNAVLRFADAGIDHVLIQDGPAGVFGGAGLTILFLNNAKSQQYYPRYGFNGDNAPAFSAYPTDQQHGMLAVDYLDYMPSQDDGMSPNPARKRCFEIMAERGITPNDQNSYASAAGVCDSVWFVERILGGTGPLTRDGALRVASSLGTSYRSSVVYGTRLSGTRRDGAALFRPARYDDACTCMKYLGPPSEPATG
ncbi:MAG TPA: hypothetical protein VNA14_09760 [Mycobacteriales bacterium]|nr:hypothetical protein [Mycobacteriales bacterium]